MTRGPVLMGVLIVSCFAPGAALAGNGNTLYLVQDGALGSNSFQSDQSQSDFSSIGTPSSPALQRGQGNNAGVTIDSDCSTGLLYSCGFLGLTQDNSQTLTTTLPANSATVSIIGDGSGTIQQIGGGNTATLQLHGSQGSITQNGQGNTAHLTVSSGAGGSIAQVGSGNTGTLDVTSIGDATTSLRQVGNGLHYDSSTDVVTTTSVDITQFKL